MDFLKSKFESMNRKEKLNLLYQAICLFLLVITTILSIIKFFDLILLDYTVVKVYSSTGVLCNDSYEGFCGYVLLLNSEVNASLFNLSKCSVITKSELEAIQNSSSISFKFVLICFFFWSSIVFSFAMQITLIIRLLREASFSLRFFLANTIIKFYFFPAIFALQTVPGIKYENVCIKLNETQLYHIEFTINIAMLMLIPGALLLIPLFQIAYYRDKVLLNFNSNSFVLCCSKLFFYSIFVFIILLEFATLSVTLFLYIISFYGTLISIANSICTLFNVSLGSFHFKS